jgi:hypothetical protein
MSNANEIQEAVKLSEDSNGRKFIGKKVYVWGDARSWLTGAMCPEENAIPKDKAMRLVVEGWSAAAGFTWGLKIRGYAHASVKDPNA